jgi:hypothetical protein
VFLLRISKDIFDNFVSNNAEMKKRQLIFIIVFWATFFLLPGSSFAQCSICTKTAQQLGEKPAKGMNSGILYLAFAPFAIVGFVAYRWLKNNRE